MRWSPELRSRVATLACEGQSAKQIADQIEGLTKNAVIGALHRINGYRRSEHPAGADPAGERNKPQPRKPTVATLARPPMIRPKPPPKPQPPAHPVPEAGRASPFRTCQWVLGGGATGDHHFHCGEANVPGYSFCETHCRLAYQNWGAHRGERRT